MQIFLLISLQSFQKNLYTISFAAIQTELGQAEHSLTFFAYILLKVCLAIFKRVTPWPGCLYLCSNNKKSLQRGCIAMQQSNILNCFSFERARGGTTLKNQGDALLDESLYFCSLQQFCKLGTYMWYIQCVSPRGTIFATENGIFMWINCSRKWTDFSWNRYRRDFKTYGNQIGPKR